MLPGVELARRRRVHFHGDVATSSSSSGGAGEHAYNHHYYYAHAHHAAPAAGVAGPALAARIRLEEKLRGAALPMSPSRWSRLMRDGRSTAATPRQHSQSTRRDEQDDAAILLPSVAEHEPWQPAPPDPATLVQSAAVTPAVSTASTQQQRRRRAELTRTLSMVDVCAVCLEEVRERQQRVTRLPCSHKYHSECVLPWLAMHPDCPCCRALVPSADTLVQA